MFWLLHHLYKQLHLTIYNVLFIFYIRILWLECYRLTINVSCLNMSHNQLESWGQSSPDTNTPFLLINYPQLEHYISWCISDEKWPLYHFFLYRMPKIISVQSYLPGIWILIIILLMIPKVLFSWRYSFFGVNFGIVLHYFFLLTHPKFRC